MSNAWEMAHYFVRGKSEWVLTLLKKEPDR